MDSRLAETGPGSTTAALSVVTLLPVEALASVRSVELMDAAREALREASTIDDVQQVRNRAEAFALYARKQRLGVEIQHTCAKIKLIAERRGGEMLAALPKLAGARPTGSSVATPLRELGITKDESYRWQLVASLPEDEFERLIEAPPSSRRELTTSAVVKLARQRRAQAARPNPRASGDGSLSVSSLDSLVTAGERFACILADPPWHYANQGTRAATDNHYRTMTVSDIAAMPVADLAADDAHAHVWSTNAFIADTITTVLPAWGFEYKSVFVWTKPEMGTGNYWRVSHEYLVLGVRGTPSWGDRGIKSWAEYSRSYHSTKPEEVRGLVERVSPGPRLELFGRKVVPGWVVFGNQVEGEPEP